MRCAACSSPRGARSLSPLPAFEPRQPGIHQLLLDTKPVGRWMALKEMRRALEIEGGWEGGGAPGDGQESPRPRYVSDRACRHTRPPALSPACPRPLASLVQGEPEQDVRVS